MVNEQIITPIKQLISEKVGNTARGGYAEPGLGMECPEFLWDVEDEQRFEVFAWMDRVIVRSAFLANEIVANELSKLTIIEETKYEHLRESVRNAEHRLRQYYDPNASGKKTQKGAIALAYELLREARSRVDDPPSAKEDTVDG